MTKEERESRERLAAVLATQLQNFGVAGVRREVNVVTFQLAFAGSARAVVYVEVRRGSGSRKRARRVTRAMARGFGRAKALDAEIGAEVKT